MRSNGGSDGIRTRGRRVKSPSLYLTKLQTHHGIGGFPLTATERLDELSAGLHQSADAFLRCHHNRVTDANEQTDLYHTLDSTYLRLQR